MFDLVDAPTQFPGRGLMGFNSDLYVSTGVDFNGWVYLERQTVHEAATLFGYTSPEDTAVLRERLHGYELELSALSRRIEELDPIVKAIRNVARELQPAA